ncbi:MAG: type I 3-dehydroquinate dehydratase [Candidatus Bathyarchaeota archaeon]|nr:type I 3-dehydroquinate dehydratase [Candidatus Bathyarchaeota archaeon]
MRICVAIKATTTDETIKKMLMAEDADLIELRLDYQREPLHLESLRVALQKPLIATNRRKDQGGYAEEPEDKRIRLLLDAVDAGFEMVDLSSTTEKLPEQVRKVQGKGREVIVSYHDFKHALKETQLMEIHERLAETGCDKVKIIGWADSYMDNLPYLNYNKRCPGNIAFAMGEKGTISRILAPLAGAAYTYASLDEEVAPGQIPLKMLRMTYRSLKQ